MILDTKKKEKEIYIKNIKKEYRKRGREWESFWTTIPYAFTYFAEDEFLIYISIII